jgi:hypothetical protein
MTVCAFKISHIDHAVSFPEKSRIEIQAAQAAELFVRPCVVTDEMGRKAEAAFLAKANGAPCHAASS